MVTTDLQPKVKPQVRAVSGKPSRLFFIDHLRAVLAILVVLHHVSLVYGASLDGFYYLEPPYNDPLAFVALLVFALFNQSWFMGAFFLLAGYFTPGSLDRRGPGSFIKDRLLRLGIPLLVFYFVLNPISSLGYYLMPSSLTGITSPPTWQAYPYLIGLGPLWFVAMLLIFNVGYAAWRWVIRNKISSSTGNTALPGYLGIGVFILALAAVSYLVRFILPLGKNVAGFPSLAYLPQYLSFFIIGVVASRGDWFRKLPGSMGFVGIVSAAIAGVVLFPLAFSGQWFSLNLTDALDNAMGNGHWQSAVYALWDSIFAVGLCLGLIPFFHRFINEQGKIGRFLSQHSYAVYIVHIPVVVYLAYLMRNIDLASLPKFGLAALIMVVASYAVAYAIRKLPLATKVL